MGKSLSLSVGAFALALAACSMITTEPLGNSTGPVREGAITYTLPMTLVKLAVVRYATSRAYDIAEFSETPCGEQKFCSEVLTVPDPIHRYLVNYKGNAFYDDELTLTVSEKGYMKNAWGKSVDRTGDILVSATRFTLGDVPEPKAFSDERGAPSLIDVILLDPHDAQMLDAVNGRLHKYGLGLSCAGACGPRAPPVAGQAEQIYYRHKSTIFLSVSHGASVTPKSVYPLLSFNGSPLIAHRIERSPFVTRETTVAYHADGMVNQVKHNKPSEALGLVTIAGKVAGAIVFAPVNALTQQTNQLTAQKNYLVAREALLKQQADSIQAAAKRSAVADVRVPPTNPALSVGTAMDAGRDDPASLSKEGTK